MRILIAFGLFLTFLACGQNPEKQNADAIVNKAIERAGGDILDNATIAFDFRDKHYEGIRENGAYTLSRCPVRKCFDTLDVLNNTGFERSIKGIKVELSEKDQKKYGNAVNSVHYFSVLPYGLDNASVKKEFVDTVTVKGKSYYKIKVDFEKEGGGTDYEDEYMYWVSTADYTIDYLAYNYHVNEGGTRFREAYNPREINGVRVVDYKNYETKEQFPPLKSLDSLFVNGQLKFLSLIDLKNVEIKVCPNC